MKAVKAAGIAVCTIILILAASCGMGEKKAGRVPASNPNNVQSILDQGTLIPEDPAIPEQVDELIPAPTSEPAPDISGQTGDECIDLTVLSATMVYSEVYNMMYYPENYVGKTVRMSGIYTVYRDEITDRLYHACIISDATACCSQGIEFELTDDYSYPEDYPDEGGQICVEGVFDTYREGEYEYCTLRNAKMTGQEQIKSDL
ncbi:MAG: hypothetical protein K5886_04665 [Lachnospiraceae bacterium]|nr:hypothetical protein [Lachnospiraceae bacterium]